MGGGRDTRWYAQPRRAEARKAQPGQTERDVNIGEIARRAGVSRSTVSYALSRKRPVGEATRRRILAVINEVDYRPNATARALAAGSTRTIGLVVPPLHHHLSIDQLHFVGAV